MKSETHIFFFLALHTVLTELLSHDDQSSTNSTIVMMQNALIAEASNILRLRVQKIDN